MRRFLFASLCLLAGLAVLLIRLNRERDLHTRRTSRSGVTSRRRAPRRPSTRIHDEWSVTELEVSRASTGATGLASPVEPTTPSIVVEVTNGRDVTGMLHAQIVHTASRSLLSQIAEDRGVIATSGAPTRHDLVAAILDAPLLDEEVGEDEIGLKRTVALLAEVTTRQRQASNAIPRARKTNPPSALLVSVSP